MRDHEPDLGPLRSRSPGLRKASIAKMVGDGLREASVLILVFGFLDVVVGSEHTDQTTPRSIVLVLSVTLFVAGAILERIRR